MSAQNWPLVNQRIAELTGSRKPVLNVTPVSGGDINQSWCLDAGQQKFFLKTNSRECLSMFEAEKAGLEAIRKSRSLRVPEVYDCGQEANCAFLLMEFIELNQSVDLLQFAQQLSAMHHFRHTQFGFDIDNTIGSSPQTNQFCDDWIDFWQRQRLGAQIKLAQQNGLSSVFIDKAEHLNQKLEALFSSYRPLASLLHGDLWRGNYAADDSGNTMIYDPACYYGDHEADLAMLELFGQPGQSFFDAYHDHFAIDAGYPVRRDLYNLYHLINHANLFGGSYIQQSISVTEKLLAQI